MNTTARGIGAVCMALCWLTVAASAPGQNLDAARMLYSHGVHTYFDGNAGGAEHYLTQAIQSDPGDPRAYYFRAMSRLRMGRDMEARSDMQVGAALEAQRPNRFAVGTALQRVQGSHRLLLEQYRRQAREQYALQREQENRARYEQVTGREADVLRRKVEVPLEGLLSPDEVRSIQGARPPVELRRPSPPPATTTAPSDVSEMPAEAMSGDPFADDPVPAESATTPPAERPDDDLFGAPPVKVEADPFEAAPAEDDSQPDAPEETDDDPFSFGEDDPFGL